MHAKRSSRPPITAPATTFGFTFAADVEDEEVGRAEGGNEEVFEGMTPEVGRDGTALLELGREGSGSLNNVFVSHVFKTASTLKQADSDGEELSSTKKSDSLIGSVPRVLE